MKIKFETHSLFLFTAFESSESESDSETESHFLSQVSNFSAWDRICSR